MARKKPTPKPLLATKFDFVDSLNNLIQQSVTLVGVIEMTLAHGSLAPPVKELLAEQLEKFRAAIFAGDPPEEEQS